MTLMQDRADAAEQIRHHQSNVSSSGPVVFTILLVPRATELCRKVLEDEGVAGDVNVEEVSYIVHARRYSSS
jgi:hypothetical protein